MKSEVARFTEKRDYLAEQIEQIKEDILSEYAKHKEGNLQLVITNSEKKKTRGDVIQANSIRGSEKAVGREYAEQVDNYNDLVYNMNDGVDRREDVYE